MASSDLPDMGHEWPNPSRWEIAAYYIVASVMLGILVAIWISL